MMRIPPKGNGRSWCSSGTLEEKMALPELLCVVMSWDMMVVMRAVFVGKRYCVSGRYVGDGLYCLAHRTSRHVSNYMLNHQEA